MNAPLLRFMEESAAGGCSNFPGGEMKTKDEMKDEIFELWMCEVQRIEDAHNRKVTQIHFQTKCVKILVVVVAAVTTLLMPMLRRLWE